MYTGNERRVGFSSGFAMILAVFLWIGISNGREVFSVSNLDSLPDFERYEFTGKGSKVKELPVVIQYRLRHEGKENAQWLVDGQMTLRNTVIKEKYTILHKNLLITDYKRTQLFDRGTIENSAKLDVDVITDDPNEFIVGTIPGLMYILRTYPFDSPLKELQVRAPQQEKGYLNLRVRNKGLKTIDTDTFGAVPVWHLEVSLMVPIIGGILPKLDYFFRDDAQKTLVALRGILPATGNKLDVELTKYEKK